VTRRATGGLTRDESDRLVRAARVFSAVLHLLNGDRTTASAWLLSAQPTLDGAVPLVLSRTELGAREVERAVGQLTTRN